MGSDPFALPNPVVLLCVLAVALVAVPGLLGYGIVTLARRSRASLADRALRCLAALAAAAAIGVYAAGALSMFQDETAANQACAEAVGPALAGRIDGYETSFVPLRFACRVDGADSYEVFVPGWTNPAALGLAVLTLVLTAVSRSATGATPATPTTRSPLP